MLQVSIVGLFGEENHLYSKPSRTIPFDTKNYLFLLFLEVILLFDRYYSLFALVQSLVVV